MKTLAALVVLALMLPVPVSAQSTKDVHYVVRAAEQRAFVAKGLGAVIVLVDTPGSIIGGGKAVIVRWHRALVFDVLDGGLKITSNVVEHNVPFTALRDDRVILPPDGL